MVAFWMIYRFKTKNTNANWKEWTLFAVFSVISSMIVAFVVTGLVSMIRLFWKLDQTTPPTSEWFANAVWGSIGWWLATALLLSLFLMLRKFIASGDKRI